MSIERVATSQEDSNQAVVMQMSDEETPPQVRGRMHAASLLSLSLFSAELSVKGITSFKPDSSKHNAFRE